jgi:LacI family transcriptional regulator
VGVVSLLDVARRAGVSPGTASRVLSQAPYPVREELQRRVLEAAAELDYSPSALARALVRDESRIVGVLVHDITDPYFGEIVRGLEDAAAASGYLVLVR